MLVLFRRLQYWNTKMVYYCPILRYQYLGLEVYFFRYIFEKSELKYKVSLQICGSMKLTKNE